MILGLQMALGDSSDGFNTTVLPKANGPAIALPDTVSDAFHGAIAPHDSMNSRTTRPPVVTLPARDAAD